MISDDVFRKSKAVGGFTARYDVKKLVWATPFEDVGEAIAYEKRLKKWRRDWKINLIEEENPNWVDLHEVLNQ